LPFENTLHARIDWSRRDSWKQIAVDTATDAEPAARAVAAPGYSTWFALGLAFIAGLALNIMPCVWPVLPIIIMRIVDQAKKGRRQSVMMGLAFCVGILLFFACLAGANIVFRSFYDQSLSWGDHLRNPAIVTALSLLMIVMALFMFGIFTFAIPSSIAGKSGSGKGYAGSLGMGFLAAILSTPCSFGLLTVAFVWAQGQPLALGTLAIMVIGLGMAAPYAILTSMPGWLGRLPRGGRWMELFKQTLGFVLLIIAVKLIKAVPDENKINLLYFAVILSFGIWVWSAWVPYGTKLSRKLLVRGVTALLVILSFWFFFKPELVDWQDYDSAVIETARSEQTPVLIKFTADWCTNCEVVDKFVYQRRDVANLIEKKGVLAVKGDTTEAKQAATLDLKNIYNEPGVPVTILWLPGQTEPVRLHELFFHDELKELLEPLPDKD
jgi:thiol:disulfide interchange protein DsbD